MASENKMASPSSQIPIPVNGVDYRGKIVLAPMVRSGELPSRLMALRYGADLVWGPETVDKAIIGTTRRINPLTGIVEFTRFSSNKMGPPRDSDGDHSSSNPDAGLSEAPPCGRESIIFSIDPVRETQAKKLIFQLGTATPELAVEAAKIVAADVAGIDVNSGCPKPFSTCGGMGAALLKDPDRLCSILRALVAEVGRPFEIGISVKIRILPEEAQTIELVSRLCQTGITGLTVHCRMVHMRPRERALREQVSAIVRTCHAAGVACIINGDVRDRADGLELMSSLGVDGAMIATSAEKNPSVFRPGGPVGWRDVVPEYVDTAIEVANRWGNTKFLLAQVIPGKALQASLPARSPVKNLAGAKTYQQLITMMRFLQLAAESEGQASAPASELASEGGGPIDGESANGDDPTGLEPVPVSVTKQTGGDLLAIDRPFSAVRRPDGMVRAKALDYYLGLGGQVSRAERRAHQAEQQAQQKEEAGKRRAEKRRRWELEKENRAGKSATSGATGTKGGDLNQNGKRVSEDEEPVETGSAITADTKRSRAGQASVQSSRAG